MPAPSRRPKTPAGTAGKRVPGGHNRRRRLATRRCDTKRAGTTAVVPATIEWQQCLLHLHFFDTLKEASEDASFGRMIDLSRECHFQELLLVQQRQIGIFVHVRVGPFFVGGSFFLADALASGKRLLGIVTDDLVDLGGEFRGVIQ